MEDVRRKIQILVSGLDDLSLKHKNLFLRRGGGFLQGIAFNKNTKATKIVEAMRARHVLAVPTSDNTMRLLPPLTITDDEIKILLDALDDVLDQLTP